MQETIYKEVTNKEYFSGEDDEDIKKKMDGRLVELQTQGHTFVRRYKVGRNDKCPCGSLLKFKKCCIDKVKGDL